MKIVIIVIIIILAICLFSSIVDTNRFVVRHYDIVSGKISRDTRFVLISDLHCKEYDKGNSRLLSAIDEEKPDAVLIAGDLANGSMRSDPTPALELAINLASRYPVYYGLGNHELRLKSYQDIDKGRWDEYEKTLRKKGVNLVGNGRITMPDHGTDIAAFCGDLSYYNKLSRKKLSAEDISADIGDAASDKFQVLIAHDPVHFDAYSEWGADLVVSGHIHGGIVRLPFLSGIVSPRPSLFPKYSGGEYELGSSKMIVSCGLGMHTIKIRVFNPGELSVIDIRKS